MIHCLCYVVVNPALCIEGKKLSSRFADKFGYSSSELAGNCSVR